MPLLELFRQNQDGIAQQLEQARTKKTMDKWTGNQEGLQEIIQLITSYPSTTAVVEQLANLYQDAEYERLCALVYIEIEERDLTREEHDETMRLEDTINARYGKNLNDLAHTLALVFRLDSPAQEQI